MGGPRGYVSNMFLSVESGETPSVEFSVKRVQSNDGPDLLMLALKFNCLVRFAKTASGFFFDSFVLLWSLIIEMISRRLKFTPVVKCHKPERGLVLNSFSLF